MAGESSKKSSGSKSGDKAEKKLAKKAAEDAEKAAKKLARKAAEDTEQVAEFGRQVGDDFKTLPEDAREAAKKKASKGKETAKKTTVKHGTRPQTHGAAPAKAEKKRRQEEIQRPLQQPRDAVPDEDIEDPYYYQNTGDAMEEALDGGPEHGGKTKAIVEEFNSVGNHMPGPSTGPNIVVPIVRGEIAMGGAEGVLEKVQEGKMGRCEDPKCKCGHKKVSLKDDLYASKSLGKKLGKDTAWKCKVPPK